MIYRWFAYLGLLGVFGLMGCGGAAPNDGSGLPFENTIFTNTQRFNATVNVPQPGQPSFSWPASGRKHVVCAIFSERIQIKKNRITNVNKLLWLWHTGLGKGREGNLMFEHGVKSENDKKTPEPLTPGTYYWGVWIIDDSGTPVLSTIEYVLTIK